MNLRALVVVVALALLALFAMLNREFGARIETMEQGLQDKLAESTRTTVAYLGEIEDKLDRVLPPPRS